MTSLDYRPSIARDEDNVITRTETKRNDAYALLERLCGERGVSLSLTKSVPYSPHITIRLESWVRHPENLRVTDRRSAFLLFQPVPFHEHETTVNITLRTGANVGTTTELDVGATKKTVHENVYTFGETEAAALLDFLCGKREDLPNLAQCRYGNAGDFRRPVNQVLGLRGDKGPNLIPLALVAGLGGPFLVSPGQPPPLLFLLGIALPFAATAWLARRPMYSLSPSKPANEPRDLLRLDSWSVLLYKLGDTAERMRDDILRELNQAANAGMICEPETIWYWGLDTKEERDQLVVRFRRSICFVHVYTYGQDLYVSWDAHLNRGTWVEKEVSKGVDEKTGVLCKACTIVSGTQTLSEYDLSDCDCLIEWVHGVVTRLCRRLLEERKIEQEIDFKIQREARRGVLSSHHTNRGFDRETTAEGGGAP